VWIASHRRSAAVRGLHDFTAFIESAWDNQIAPATFAENSESSVIRNLKPAGFGTALDVGANIGEWSEAALTAWPQCQVHAFEVVPETFAILSRAFAGKPELSRLRLNCLGLSDANDVQTMYYYPDDSSLTSDVRRHETLPAVPFDARLETGDAYCQRNGVSSIDFLKIDVEGAEHRVLRGFAGLLGAGSVQCIQFEYGAFATQTRFLLGDYYALLGDQYWIGKIYPGYVEFRDYDWTFENFQFANYCCVAKRRPDLRALLEA
jgi:FkbM family methyltransferase